MLSLLLPQRLSDAQYAAGKQAARELIKEHGKQVAILNFQEALTDIEGDSYDRGYHDVIYEREPTK